MGNKQITVTTQSKKPAVSDLTDVQLSSLTSNQTLVWNGTKWVNQQAVSFDLTPHFLLMGS